MSNSLIFTCSQYGLGYCPEAEYWQVFSIFSLERSIGHIYNFQGLQSFKFFNRDLVADNEQRIKIEYSGRVR
jgi:hypothetical protein